MRIKPALLVISSVVLGGFAFNGALWTWQDHPIEDPFTLDVASFPDDAGDDADIEAAILDPMDDWNGLDLDMVLRYDGIEAGGNQDNDGFFHIYYDPDTVGSEGVLAFTGTWVWQDGAAYDCDMVFMHQNAYGEVLWSSDPDGAPDGRYDIQAVTLHELGHCIGLAHSQYSDAVMTPYYAGYRYLTPDDVYGAEALFDLPCADGDGDGVASCDGDCDDANAVVYPGAAERCNGQDDNCDGVIDNEDTVEVDLARLTVAYDNQWYAAGNAFRVDSPTALVSASQRLATDEGARLVWTVYTADRAAGPWTLVRSERSLAGPDEWQDSPALNLTMEAGKVYWVALGAHNPTIRTWYEEGADMASQGPITPLGSVAGRDLGDQNSAPDANFLWHQRLLFVDAADPDGDGVTAFCGDCAPTDASAYPNAVEVCDGVDQDCNGDIDDGLDQDPDGDGLTTCADACPLDAANDIDGDGLCGDEDACPLDAEDDADGDGQCGDVDPCADDAEDACEDPDDKGRCGCGSAGGGTPGLALLALLLLRRR